MYTQTQRENPRGIRHAQLNADCGDTLNAFMGSINSSEGLRKLGQEEKNLKRSNLSSKHFRKGLVTKEFDPQKSYKNRRDQLPYSIPLMA